MSVCLQAIVIVVSILASFTLAIVLGWPDRPHQTDDSDDKVLDGLRTRIRELGDKSDQLLLFLSFAITAVVLLGYGPSPESVRQITERIANSGALRCLVSAIFPVVVGVLPLKEFQEDCLRWYRIVRWFKFCLLWVAIAYVVVGARQIFTAL